MEVGSVLSSLLKYIPSVEEHVPLERFNSIGVGGTADYFTVARDAIELVSAVRAAIDAHLPYLVIGMGEGILFADGGFPGLVIQNSADAHVISSDHSQMIVDSGMSLERFITTAAGQGFGGLTAFYGCGGTIGAAVYRNIQMESQRFLDSVRYITMLVPPTRMKVEPTMVRYKSEWLLKDGSDMTRLQRIHQNKPLEEPYPVILNAHIQLTSVRSDEVVRRIQQQSRTRQQFRPKSPVFGPLFVDMPGYDLHLLLSTSNVALLRVPHLQVDRKNHNYIRRGKTRPTAQAVWELAVVMREAVRKTHGVDLTYGFERFGAW